MFQAHKNVSVTLKEKEHSFLLEPMVQYLLGTWIRYFQMILLKMNNKEKKKEESLIINYILLKEHPGSWEISFFVLLTYLILTSWPLDLMINKLNYGI